MDHRGQSQPHPPSLLGPRFTGPGKKNETQLLDRFQQLVAYASSDLDDSMQQRLQRHLLAQLVTLGDHNITGLLCACGRESLDWSSDYRMYSRQRIQPEQLFRQVQTSLLERLSPATA